MQNFEGLSKWADIYLDKKRFVTFLFLVIGLITASCWFSNFLLWNEQRIGYVFNDPLLNSFQPQNYSILTGVLTNVSIFACILMLLKRPVNFIYFLCAAILMIIIRSFTMYLLPLEPPALIIPLKDPILEMTFYKGEVLLRDLFFSGHTANIILMGLLSERLVIKRAMVLIGFTVGLLLLLQHVHYSIDVIFAPIFAVIVYKLSVWVGNRIFNLQNEQVKRCGNIFEELGLKK